eukprot:scaffold4905_cov98-Cylindrotheca_fusiformis.AAC.7
MRPVECRYKFTEVLNVSQSPKMFKKVEPSNINVVGEQAQSCKVANDQGSVKKITDGRGIFYAYRKPVLPIRRGSQGTCRPFSESLGFAPADFGPIFFLHSLAHRLLAIIRLEANIHLNDSQDGVCNRWNQAILLDGPCHLLCRHRDGIDVH